MKTISLILFRTVAVLGTFLLSVGLYFSPISLPFKICIPMGVLALASLFYLPFPFFMAMAFSALGDCFGALHNFPAQMGSFAAGHLAFIFFFLKLERHRSITVASTSRYASALTITSYILVSIFILPHVNNIFLRTGVAVYAFLILFMLRCALSLKKIFFWIGAVLFVFSDTVLAWNKFVSPIPAASLYIMIPYYLAQLLLFFGATQTKY